MKIDEIKTLGLSDGEVNVYSAVLMIGSCSVNSIHEKTGLERRAIYDILNKLIKKGLVSYIIETGKKTYKCAPPSKIKEKVDKKKEELDKLEKKIVDIEKIYNSSKSKIGLEILRGKEGIKTIFEDMLNYKKNYFIGGRWYVIQEMPVYWKHYNKKRIDSKVKWYNLVLDDAPKAPKTSLVEIKRLPKEFNGSPSLIWIYGNKIAHVHWTNDYFVFLMESEEIKDNYLKYFKYLWDNIAK